MTKLIGCPRWSLRSLWTGRSARTIRCRRRVAQELSLISGRLEERFKEITRQVQQRQLDGPRVAGNISPIALDSEMCSKRGARGV